jgi:hypothetical protein
MLSPKLQYCDQSFAQLANLFTSDLAGYTRSMYPSVSRKTYLDFEPAAPRAFGTRHCFGVEQDLEAWLLDQGFMAPALLRNHAEPLRFDFQQP